MKSRSLIACVFLFAAAHGAVAYSQTQATEGPSAQPAAVQAPASADVKSTSAPAPAQSAQTIIVQARQPSRIEQFIRDALLVMVLLLLVYAGVLLFAFAKAVRAGGRISVQSQWGGFGSGMGGWRMSSALSALVGAFVVLLFAAYLAGSLLHPESATLAAKEKDAKPASSTEAKK